MSEIQNCFSQNPESIEIGLDESGRGPMFGRVYAAAVVLPRDDALFYHALMCDSKTIKCKKKMHDLANYIKDAAIAYSIQYMDESVIDSVNILQANMLAMQTCVRDLLTMPQTVFKASRANDYLLLIDGNYFKPMIVFDHESGEIAGLNFMTIVKGDSAYTSIAAASILAKDARDTYIADICRLYPQLKERYGIDTNMGYGTANHIKGIREHGISQFHRRTFGICKSAILNPCLPITAESSDV
jgi:ribonuclease HII